MAKTLKIHKVETSTLEDDFISSLPGNEGLALRLILQVVDSTSITLLLSPSAALQVASHLHELAKAVHNMDSLQLKEIVEENLQKKGGLFPGHSQ